jgi:hypothetical protein
MTAPDPAAVAADMSVWLERAVIGLNLCPFAKAVHAKGQVHYAVSSHDDFAGVLDDLAGELESLLAHDAIERDTTLLVVPRGFDDFLLFNELVRQGERLLRKRGAEGVVQLASFHPAFVFAGARDDDAANCTNRDRCWPRAVAAFPEAEAIFGANMAKLRELGAGGWAALGVGPR